jgi:RND family efflux transporter MFP subunit
MWRRITAAIYALLWLAVVGVATAAALSYVLARYQREQAAATPFVATTSASHGNFLVYTDHVGNLESQESTIVNSETSGQVIGLVPNGSVVKEGDVIVALDVPRMLLAVEDAQRKVQETKDRIQTTQHDRDADVQQAELSLRRAETDLEQSQASADANRKEKEAQLQFDQDGLADDESKLERKRRLSEMGLIAGQEVRRDEVQIAGERFALDKQKENLQLEIAKAESDALSKQAQVRMANSVLERAKSRRNDEVQNAKFDSETQQRQLKRAQDDLEKALIRAPKGGLVALTERGFTEPVPLQRGDLVRTNETVAQILDLSKIQVHLELPQRVGQMVKRGQRGIVWVHGLPGQQFPGKVTQVASFATAGDRFSGPPTEERSFRTYIRAGKFKPGTLKPGMQATVRIVIAEVKNVVSVPLSCVFSRGMGRHARKIVWVRRGKRFREAPVRLGQANEESVIIESGIKAGTEIALRDLQAERAGEAQEEEAGRNPLQVGEAARRSR